RVISRAIPNRHAELRPGPAELEGDVLERPGQLRGRRAGRNEERAQRQEGNRYSRHKTSNIDPYDWPEAATVGGPAALRFRTLVVTMTPRVVPTTRPRRRLTRPS